MTNNSVENDLFYTRCPVPTALAIALETGLMETEFADDGIRIRSLASTPMAVHRDAHYTHSHPRLIRQGGNMPPLIAFDRGHHLKVIALSWTEVALPMLSLPGSGISSARDLAGKRLPLPRREGVTLDCWEPAILRGYERTLATVGLTLDDVDLIPIEVSRTFATTRFTAPGQTAPLWDREFILGLQREEFGALLRGEVDAVFSESSIAETFASMFGLSRISDLQHEADPLAKVSLPLPLTISVSGHLLEQNPFLVARWLAVLIRAADWAAGHPEETRSILAAEVSLPVDALDQALTPDPQDALTIGLDPTPLAALEDQARFLFDHGFTAAPVDVQDLIDPRPLQVARHLAADPTPTREVTVPG